MRIVLAPDKFKGSLNAAEVCAYLARGLTSALPDAQIDAVPMADGGEGTVDAAVAAGFTRVTREVRGPLGAPVEASFALAAHASAAPGTPAPHPSVSDSAQYDAVIELSAASGLLLLHDADRRPLEAHTFGTGELIKAALDAGARHIVLAVGGSASTDGGTGMLTALGVRFLDAHGVPLPLGGGALSLLHSIDLAGLDPRLASSHVTLACDVNNPLVGVHGAARVFAPQKGANPAELKLLEIGLDRLAEVTMHALPHDPNHALAVGAGAAGGVGFGALAFLGATQRAGASVVSEVAKLAASVQGADLVITGEGSFDDQSLGGKTPIGVLNIARGIGVRTALVCGKSSLSARATREAGFCASYAIADLDPDPASCIALAGHYLEQIAREIAASLTSARGAD
ncbi:glycerate kinase [Leucobacter sp. HY1910]